MEAKKIIANRVAKEFKDGDFINLGIGLPTLVANYIPKEIKINLHSENGFAGLWDKAEENDIDENMIDAGRNYVKLKAGGVFFDSVSSFEIIRGGHIDITVLGALEVDEEASLASWTIPGKFVPGMGGSMDLVSGVKKVIVAMQHTAKGAPKILERCTLPLTGKSVIDMLITELGVFEYVDGKLHLTELMGNTTLEEIKEQTPATYIVALK
ncbi:3-oxoacid CoA-transferase subunit B [Poseidonibacter antarcticus]|uniref:3-oxoacid CoA-transferase subunit B n=1 Tax=Poseidonibacter antarcticus TaxID=2478538 RepID=UPI000EF44B45|nr:3-oxoacid CoA-transferase subunit B [Poseidonibacter antarcticus]